MIKLLKQPAKTNKKSIIKFAVANARLEGHRVALSQVKDGIRLLDGKVTIEELIDKTIKSHGLS